MVNVNIPRIVHHYDNFAIHPTINSWENSWRPTITSVIKHSTHYLFSDWPKAYSEFSKSVPGTSSSCSYHVKDTQGHWESCRVRPRCMISRRRSKHITSRFASLTEQDIEKKSWRQGLTKHKKVDEGGKGAVCWLREREKAFYVEARKKEFVQWIIRQSFYSVFVISRIIKISVRVIPTSTLIILDITKTSSNNCY